MKKYPLFFSILALLIVSVMSFAQQTKKPQTKDAVSNPVDTRIDNMGYWMEKAKQGLVPYNQSIPVLPAEFKGSQINVKGIKSKESTDVAVTTLTWTSQNQRGKKINFTGWN